MSGSCNTEERNKNFITKYFFVNLKETGTSTEDVFKLTEKQNVMVETGFN
jgi:hypothetical protein